MIIKNFFNKIKINEYTLFLLLICFVTGLIKEVSAILLLVIFHEFGHYLASYIFKWNISVINIYPFGGYIKYNEIIDKPLFEEFIITISGPLNQLFVFFIIYLLNKNYLVSDNYYSIISNYNFYMLIFNLIPIIPLDGSKLLNILLNKIFNYRLSYYILEVISVILLIIFVICVKNNYSYYMIISFLGYELYIFIKNRGICFNRFIYEKYLYKNNYRKYYKINSIKKFKRNKKHLVKYNNSYILEKEYIKKIKGV